MTAARSTTPTAPHVRRGIPTEYAGIQFRSRIEARWAAFFDFVRWPWVYEPTDLPGYVPDFALTFPLAPVLIEVKHELTRAALVEPAKRFALAGWRGEFVVVGAHLLEDPSHPDCASLGRMGQWTPGPDGDGATELGDAIVHHCTRCDALSFHHSDAAWRCVRSGCANGNALLGHVGISELRTAWAVASNRVQWRAPGEP
jgi:hypothetical protein